MHLLPRPQQNNKLGIKSKPQQSFKQPELEFINQPTVSGDNQERIAIFVDGSNLFYAATHLNIEINYTRLLCCLTKKPKLLRAYFYTAIDQYSGQFFQRFYKAFRAYASRIDLFFQS